MPRKNNLTDAGRRKGAATTNRIIAVRKAKRLAKVKELLAAGTEKQEIARLLGVRPETISRDLRDIEKSQGGSP